MEVGEVSAAAYLATRPVLGPCPCQRCGVTDLLALVEKLAALRKDPDDPEGRRYLCQVCIDGFGPKIRLNDSPGSVRQWLPALPKGVEPW